MKLSENIYFSTIDFKKEDFEEFVSLVEVGDPEEYEQEKLEANRYKHAGKLKI